MEYKTQYEYYRGKDFLSTHADFKSIEDLKKHENERKEIFTNKLFLLPAIFKNADLIEFGPDCGENSLVFGYWGAKCRLIEPNIKTHSIIKEYFDKFSLKNNLVSIEEVDVKDFSENADKLLKKRYDFVDAEGFIYTIKPNDIWINLFSRTLKQDGFVLIDYYEKFGAYIELSQKVIHSRIKSILGVSSLEAAERVFRVKWNSMPHRRKMEVWVKDVLESPFVRLKYFLDAQKLCKEMHKAGFQLYSSWPNYKDSLNIHWLKKQMSKEENLNRALETISRSRVGYLFGRKHFFIKETDQLEKELYLLIESNDKLIDNFDETEAKKCISALEKIKKVVNSQYLLSDEDGSKETLNIIESIQNIMRLLIEGKADEIIKFCSSDEAFIKNWGMPLHFAVFQKRI